MSQIASIPGRYLAEGLHVVDRRSGNARVCECTTPAFAARVAQALNLMGQLEEAHTSDHDEMLRLALAALKSE